MAKRALRVVKNLGRIPAVAVCTVCGKTFEAPLGALVSVKDTEANLQQQARVPGCVEVSQVPGSRRRVLRVGADGEIQAAVLF